MKIKILFIIAGLALLLLLALACTGTGIAASIGASRTSAPAAAQPAGTEPPPPARPTITAPATPATPAGAVRATPAPNPINVPPPSAPSPINISSQPAGISVTGEASVSVEPDLAVLKIGVQTQSQSVAVARADAATAMAAVKAAVKEHGLTDADIRTTSFSLRPRYDYRDGEETLIGYQVRHDTAMQIRDLDLAGEIIDDAAAAGGNSTRINGITYTVEDRTPFLKELRQAAVRNAVTKASHYAYLTGVTMGKLVYLAEGGGGSPRGNIFAASSSMMAEADSASTDVSAGQLTLTLTVQAVFGIK